MSEPTSPKEEQIENAPKETKSERITSSEKTGSKPKNPNRVAAGKRAAELSRLARLRAKQEQEKDEKSEEGSSYLPYAGGVAIVAGAAVGIGYYLFGEKKDVIVFTPAPKPVTPKEPATTTVRANPRKRIALD